MLTYITITYFSPIYYEGIFVLNLALYLECQILESFSVFNFCFADTFFILFQHVLETGFCDIFSNCTFWGLFCRAKIFLKNIFFSVLLLFFLLVDVCFVLILAGKAFAVTLYILHKRSYRWVMLLFLACQFHNEIIISVSLDRLFLN